MTFHVLDLIMFVLLSMLYWWVLPEQCKKELGMLAGLFWYLAFTFIYAVLFVMIDFNWSDILNKIALRIDNLHFTF